QIFVAGVLPPALSHRTQEGFKFGMARSKKRTHNGATDLFLLIYNELRPNSAKSVQTSATDQPHKDGFRLIVQSMCGCDTVQLAFSDQAFEIVVANFAGRSFEAHAVLFCICRHVVYIAMKFKFMLL